MLGLPSCFLTAPVAQPQLEGAFAMTVWPYFTGDTNEAQRGSLTCSRTHSLLGQQRPEPMCPDLCTGLCPRGSLQKTLKAAPPPHGWSFPRPAWPLIVRGSNIHSTVWISPNMPSGPQGPPPAACCEVCGPAQRSPQALGTLTCPGSHQHIQAIEDVCRIVQDQPQCQVLRLQLVKAGPEQREGAQCVQGRHPGSPPCLQPLDSSLTPSPDAETLTPKASLSQGQEVPEKSGPCCLSAAVLRPQEGQVF